MSDEILAAVIGGVVGALTAVGALLMQRSWDTAKAKREDDEHERERTEDLARHAGELAAERDRSRQALAEERQQHYVWKNQDRIGEVMHRVWPLLSHALILSSNAARERLAGHRYSKGHVGYIFNANEALTELRQSLFRESIWLPESLDTMLNQAVLIVEAFIETATDDAPVLIKEDISHWTAHPYMQLTDEVRRAIGHTYGPMDPHWPLTEEQVLEEVARHRLAHQPDNSAATATNTAEPAP